MDLHDHDKADRNKELVAARKMLSAGDFRAARFHLQSAGMFIPWDHKDLRQIQREIQAAERGTRYGVLIACGVGFGIALACYLCLSVQQPLDWGVPVWALLAFLVVPAIAGFVAGRSLGAEHGRGMRFRTAAAGGGAAMACYAGVTLALLRARFEVGDDGFQVFGAWLLCTLAYSLIAGVVAGLAGAASAGLRPKGSGGTNVDAP